ncbi:molecular chaperone TorD family protein [Thermosyntropha sp.]|uniref:TorD/DmsD family molecular chaperone n=1 Tax=Thermosyntropha sp. TaxID=2740820 RepID=UPI0025ECB940|nr:molecular chaperone TorD family protein [Thermosyntropha sp.]MBO8159224.1 molecular chaperone TorD family protein [Thermosyntropha sp.]
MSEISIDADLFWAAKELFVYPEEERLNQNRQNMLNLVQFTEGSDLTDIIEFKNLLKSGYFELEKLEVDFTRLFINGVPTAKAHPFAGWYMGDEIVFGESDRSILNFYAAYGLNYDLSQSIPADHILVELEFIAVMLEEYEKSRQGLYLKAVEEFIDGHVTKWVPFFAKEIRNHAETVFYRGAAMIVENLFNRVLKEIKGREIDG